MATILVGDTVTKGVAQIDDTMFWGESRSVGILVDNSSCVGNGDPPILPPVCGS